MLSGVRILIPRLRDDSEYSSSIILENGGIPVYAELVRVEYTGDVEKLDRSINRINEYHWIVFTSKTGVKIFAEKMRKRNTNPVNLRFAAVGPSTSSEAEKHGIKISFIPSKYLTKVLARELPDVVGRRILLIRSFDSSEEMRSILTERGGLVDEVRPYRVMPSDNVEIKESFDAVILTSPSITNILSKIPSIVERIRNGAIVCCIGPVTAEAAREAGIRVDIVSGEHTFPGAVRALTEWMRNAGNRC